MSFPRYPSYKPSGVDLLGSVPSHWEVRELRHIGRLIKGSGGSKEDIVEVGVPCVRYGDLYTTHSFHIEDARTHVSRERASAYTPIQFGDVLFAASGEKLAEIGKSAVNLIRTEAVCGGDLVLLRPRAGVASRFIGYASDAAPSVLQKASMGHGTTVKHIYPDELRHLALALPPEKEQQAIAAFLDRETAKIDALVAQQERFIELLKEKRQAVISHAVTKGLNPDAPMKDSGIEGLGLVPQHWDVTKMKWVAKMESGHTPDKKVADYWDGGAIPWVSLNDTGYLKDHDFITDTAYQITDAGMANSSAHLLPARAVVFSRDATIGRCAITTRPMAVSQHFIAWLCGPRLLPEFLLLRLRSMTQELDRLTTGATIKTIGMPEVRTIATPVPPLDQQKAIVARVTDRSAAFDALVAEAEHAAVLLQERRTALISAAVTGQIDVRPEATRTAA